jgi:hypothetical protein
MFVCAVNMLYNKTRIYFKVNRLANFISIITSISKTQVANNLNFLFSNFIKKDSMLKGEMRYLTQKFAI